VRQLCAPVSQRVTDFSGLGADHGEAACAA